MMSDNKPKSLEERLEALELDVRTIRADIDDIRKIILSEHDHFIHLNAEQDRLVDVIIDRLDLIEDRLEPAFIKTFPDYGQALHEIGLILDAPRKR